MVYDPGVEFMKFWMCSYYEIPYEVEFIYLDAGEALSDGIGNNQESDAEEPGVNVDRSGT